MKPINLFVDTSIFINFYSNSDSQIKELSKLIQLLKGKLVYIYLPDHIRNEFLRRRDEVINSTLENFKNKIISKIPTLMGHLDNDSKNYIEACKEVCRLHSKLLKNVRSEAITRTLPADKLFNERCETTPLIPLSAEMKYEAEQRAYLGNPPGKKILMETA